MPSALLGTGSKKVNKDRDHQDVILNRRGWAEPGGVSHAQVQYNVESALTLCRGEWRRNHCQASCYIRVLGVTSVEAPSIL